MITKSTFPLVILHCHLSVATQELPLNSAAAAAAKSLQSCPTLCNPIDDSPPGSPVPGILQARTLEWVAISFSNAWKWKVKEKSLSQVRLLVIPWTAAHQAPPSMEFSRQEYWTGMPLSSPLNSRNSVLWKEFTTDPWPIENIYHWALQRCQNSPYEGVSFSFGQHW